MTVCFFPWARVAMAGLRARFDDLAGLRLLI
jgi:hypothetical protein